MAGRPQVPMQQQQQQQQQQQAGANLQSFKLVLLGEQAVGKSSIVLRFMEDKFYENVETTVGAAFLTKVLDLEGYSVKLEIWDTAGQERYQSLAPMYYRSAHAAVVAYDITDGESYNRARKWVREVQLQGNQNQPVIIALVGNKSDRPERAVQSEIARAFAEENGLIFLEASAKTGANIQRVFQEIGKRLPRKKAANEGIRVGEEAGEKKKGCC